MTRQRADYPLDYTRTNGTQHSTQTFAEAAADKVKDATDRVEDVAAEVARQAQIYGAKAQEAVNNFKPYVEKSLKEQPYTTLAFATALAFVLGALWKR